jgi:hypothetical protein
MSGPFRLAPSVPVTAMKTYSIRSPHDTLVRAACEQVGCEAWRHGWDSVIDERTNLGQFQASYIRQSSGRTFSAPRTG